VEAVPMARALDGWDEGSDRAPLVARDGGGKWWWRGLRAVWKTHGGGERVTVDGRQCLAQRRMFQTDRRGEVLLWVVDDMGAGAGAAGKFKAPLPLASKDDGLAYYRLGVHGGNSPAECAKVMGWTGAGASDAAEKFLDLVHAHAKGWTREDMGKRLAAVEPFVSIPGAPVADAPPRITWAEACALLEALRGDVETLREDLRATSAEVARLADLVI
jgi:hypothetical protein